MKRFLVQLFSLILIVLLVYVVVSVRPYRVSGDSMDPTLLNDEIILIDRFSPRYLPLKRGDVAVFSDTTSGEPVKVKRIIGLPGEKLEIRDGKVLLGENEIEERYLQEHVRTCLPGSCTDLSSHIFDVPADHYFVLGDNRENSSDSRGCRDMSDCKNSSPMYIPQEEIMGRVIWDF